jgi:hypothetical protein
MTLPIVIVEHQQVFTPEMIELLGTEHIIACDFYVSGAETAEPVPGGFSFGRVLNIDHHADKPSMKRFVSSTNLALDRIRELGVDAPSSTVVISHADCDSVLSAGIVSGHLDPDLSLGMAAIAADHTGEENVVADLLQELDNLGAIAKLNPADQQTELLYRFDAVKRLIEDGEDSLDDRALTAIVERRRKRNAAAAFSENGLSHSGGLAFGLPTEKLDGEFFPSLVPDAVAILLMTKGRSSHWHARIRLGLSAPEGFDLNSIGIAEFDPNFGGRWNAGSNARNGGTRMSPSQYRDELTERIVHIAPR